jgi:hypothetical protein
VAMHCVQGVQQGVCAHLPYQPSVTMQNVLLATHLHLSLRLQVLLDSPDDQPV